MVTRRKWGGEEAAGAQELGSGDDVMRKHKGRDDLRLRTEEDVDARTMQEGGGEDGTNARRRVGGGDNMTRWAGG